MHCEFACFPKVKETLESAGGVDEVTLAAQQEEGVLDNRQVIVKYQPGFNVREAIATLEAAGYTESEIVQESGVWSLESGVWSLESGDN